MTLSDRGALVATIVAALVAGGVAGAGVALQWYPPAVGVVLAALIGLGVGRHVLQARRARRMSNR